LAKVLSNVFLPALFLLVSFSAAFLGFAERRIIKVKKTIIIIIVIIIITTQLKESSSYQNEKPISSKFRGPSVFCVFSAMPCFPHVFLSCRG
jgi:uncharacterized membrane protein